MSVPPKSQYGNLAALLGTIGERKYVHLTFHFDKPLEVGVFNRIKASIEGMVDDWLKYGRDSWILYTKETPEKVYQKLMRDVPELKPHGILTFYFDINAVRGGQQEQWVWDWFSKKR